MQRILVGNIQSSNAYLIGYCFLLTLIIVTMCSSDLYELFLNLQLINTASQVSGQKKNILIQSENLPSPNVFERPCILVNLAKNLLHTQIIWNLEKQKIKLPSLLLSGNTWFCVSSSQLYQ